ncbi:MAG TPA: NUDIX domain-containing protein [Burkholderiales bacterium]
MKLLEATLAVMKAWDESKHPRKPKGTPQGGEFDSGLGGAKGWSLLDWLKRKPQIPTGPAGAPPWKSQPDDPFGHTLSPWDMGASSDSSESNYYPMGLFAPVKPRPGSKLHPMPGEDGKPVRIQFPTRAGPPENVGNPLKVATFVPGGDVPHQLGGVVFSPWTPPATLEGWKNVSGQNPHLEESHPFKQTSAWWTDSASGKKFQPKTGAGVIIVENDGRVWLTRPTNSFGNYVHTFPKGTVEHGLSLQASAIKEAYEETGLKVRITGVLGDYQRTSSVARYYIARRVGGTPRDMGWESQALRLVPPERLHAFLNNATDRSMADDLLEEMHHGLKVKKARTDDELRALVSRVGALLAKARKLPGLTDAEIKAAVSFAWHQQWPNTLKSWQANGKVMNQQVQERITAAINAAKAGDLKALEAMKLGAKSSAVRDALIAALKKTPPGMDSKNPTPIAGSPVAASHFNPEQPRWPKGSPLGGQWKEYLGGLVKPPVIGGGASNPQYQSQANALFDMAQKGEWGLVGAAADKLKAKADAAAGKAKPTSHDKWNEKVLQYAQALQADHGAAPAAEAAAVKVSGFDSIDGWTKIGAKPGGSAQGAVFKDAEGTTWLVKSYKTADQAKNEVLASKLMEAAGVKVPVMKLVDTGKAFTGVGVGVASMMLTGDWKHYGATSGMERDHAREQIQNDFATHAWLANYDAVGLSGDNYVVGKFGEVAHIDPGGALLYRAQGAPKGDKFTTKATEWDSMRDPSVNGSAAEVFSPMTAANLAASAAKVAAVKPETVMALVGTYGPGSDSAKAALAAKILARRQDVLARANLGEDGATLAGGVAAQPGKSSTWVTLGHSVGSGPMQVGDVIVHDDGTKSVITAISGQKMAIMPVAATTKTTAAVKPPPIPAALAKPDFNTGFAHSDKYYDGLAEKMVAAYNAGKMADLQTLATKTLASGEVKNAWPLKTQNGKKMSEFHAALVSELAKTQGEALQQEVKAAGAALEKPVAAAAVPKPGAKKENLPAMPQVSDYTHTPKPNASPQTLKDSGAHNAKVAYLEKLAQSGDVKGLLGQAYGSNHYAQKQVEYVNNALDALGSPFKVSTSQKANSHPYLTGGATPEQLATAGVKVADVPQAPKVKVVVPQGMEMGRVPSVPDFANWNGQGKPLSSKASINEQNQQLVNTMQALAMKGNVAALKDMKFSVLDAEGKATGAEKSLKEHPSQHVQAYWKDAIDALVPKPPKPKVLAAEIQKVGDTFKALASAFPDSAKLAQFMHTVGRYGILGKVEGDPLASWKPKEISKNGGGLDVSELNAKSHAAFNALSKTEQQAIKNYTGSAYHTMNNPVTGEGTHTMVGYAIQGVQKAAVPLKPGMVFSRGIGSMSQKNINTLLKSEGHILKDFGIISTGLEPGWNSNVRLRITAGEGVKGLYVGGGISVSGHESGGEMLLPYGTKFYVRKVYPKGSFKDKHGHWQSPNVVLDVVALPN